MAGVDYANALLHSTSVRPFDRLQMTVDMNSLAESVCQGPHSANSTKLHWH